MQLYFAFGSNMDGAAMARRCPRSRLLGPGCLAAHRFALMGRTGYATIRTDPRSQVFGLVYEIDDGDMGALDDYEDVANGLYRKVMRNVVCWDEIVRHLLVYEGVDQTDGGEPLPGYMECIVAAARAARLPPFYIEELVRFLPERSGASIDALW